MKHKAPVFTLALLGALALAALAGGLLPSDSVVYAAEPRFDTDTSSRDVPENTPPGVNIGDPISATDPDETGDSAIEFGNTLTYKLGGTDAASFDIDASTGQLITKAPLDAEADPSYSVMVTVDDGETRTSDCTSCTQDVSITVTPVSESPAAPAPPTVVSGKDGTPSDETEESTTSLFVVWHPPEYTGSGTLDFTVQYKKSTETEFGSSDVNENDTTATITRLEADISYDVRVQADGGEGPGPWSFVGTGSTNKAGNSPPQSGDNTPTTRPVDENTPAGENVGSPVSATDLDTTTLTYRLEGPDAGLFNFNTRTGQIRTKAPLNHEDPRCDYDGSANPTVCTYRVTVIVVDGAGGSDATGVNVQVGDRTEPASAPARPTVRATEKSSTSLDVSWSAPQNTGPDIVNYDVEWRKGSDPFSDDNCGTETANNCQDITGTSVTIVGLEDDTTYEVRVKADNGERASAWSASGSGRASKANHDPIFDDRPGTGTGSSREDPYTVSRTIDENVRSGHLVGRVFADDEDNDRLTYELVAEDSSARAAEDLSKFVINETNGEIRTKESVAYNYEEVNTGTCGDLTQQDIGTDKCYTVEVEVRDGLNADRVKEEEEDPDDSVTLRIGVRDRDEPPAVPTVTVTSPDDETTLIAIWDAKNTGPTAVTYDVQYRKAGGTYSDDNCQGDTQENNCQDLSTTTTTITGLEVDTSYSVQVRAKNAEGTSTWSRVITLKTNKADNEPPTFTDTAATVELTVPEDTPSGRSVGTAVGASDDSSTTLTYSLGGRDAALFTIVSSSGQIRTRSALNTEAICRATDAGLAGRHQENCTYTVLVKVDDRAGGSASKAVTILVGDVDEPPVAPGAPRVTATKDTGQSLDVTWNEPRNDRQAPHHRLRHTVPRA